MSDDFPRLFQPLRIGNRESRNRVMRLATLTNTMDGNLVTERALALYRRVAAGGSGIVVSEGMRIHPSSSGHGRNVQLYQKEAVPGVERLAQVVREEGALFIAQLNHNGRQHHGAATPRMWAPSAIACPHSGGVPHEMTKAEIAELVHGFATAAAHAKQAGCDGIELHGAQGHLLQQFMSPFSNQRSDEYGGSVTKRLRFAMDIIAAVREKVGADFIVGYRMGIDEFVPGGITVDDSKEATARLAELRALDYLSLAQGNFASIDTHCPDGHYPPLPYIGIQAQVRACAGGVPVVVSTRIQTPEQAENILAAGKADIIGLCRALIADPEWPVKAMQGRSAEIRRCIFTNHCHGTGKRLSCEVNPTVGRELEMPPLVKVQTPKRVVIVGGGPAGLEAAHTAAARGHRVTLFEKSAKLGGKLTFAQHYLPFHESIHALEFLVQEVKRREVDIRTGTRATRELVLNERPDAVIVATGSEIFAPKVPGDGSVPVVVYSALGSGATVVVMDEDGYYWASCMTEQLARRGCKVIYATRFYEPLREIAEVSRVSTLRVLDELGVVLRPTMHVQRIERGQVVLQHVFNPKHEERLDGIGEVVWVGAQRASDTLMHELRTAGVQTLRLVGDAYAPRRLADAILEGHQAARAI